MLLLPPVEFCSLAALHTMLSRVSQLKIICTSHVNAPILSACYQWRARIAPTGKLGSLGDISPIAARSELTIVLLEQRDPSR